MIHVLINTLAEKMNEFLSSYYERAEIIVEAGSIDATPNEDQSDKIILSIVNIERETDRQWESLPPIGTQKITHSNKHLHHGT